MLSLKIVIKRGYGQRWDMPLNILLVINTETIGWNILHYICKQIRIGSGNGLVWNRDDDPDDKAVCWAMHRWTCIGVFNKYTKILYYKQFMQPSSLSIPSVLLQRTIIRCQWDGHQVQIVRISNRIDQSIVFVLIVPCENGWLLMTRQSQSLHNRKSWAWSRYIDLSSELPSECDLLMPYVH